jgi:hypothetical protein
MLRKQALKPFAGCGGIVSALVLVCLSACARAPQASAPATRPDLSGYWMLAFRVPPDQALMDQLPPDAVVLHDTGITELPVADFGGLKVKPEPLAQALKWKPNDDMTVSKACQPPSIVYAMQGPFPMEIHQGTDFIIFKMEYYDQVRVIFMDGRPHPPADAPHTKMGHSIGRWEGSTLVVDTTHLQASTIANNGLMHSDKVHVIERFRLSEDGRTLLSTQEFADPEVLDTPGARFIAWTREPGEYVLPYDCDPSFALEYGASQAEVTKP